MMNFIRPLILTVICMATASTFARAESQIWLRCDVLNHSATPTATLTLTQKSGNDFSFCVHQRSESCTEEFVIQLSSREIIDFRHALDAWGSNGAWQSNRWQGRAGSGALAALNLELVRVSGGRWHLYGNLNIGGEDRRLWCY